MILVSENISEEAESDNEWRKNNYNPLNGL